MGTGSVIHEPIAPRTPRPAVRTAAAVRAGRRLTMTDTGLWSYKEIAAHIRVQPDTVRSYRKHGLLPSPDHVENGKPYWFADTIRAWVANRPGNRGRRG
ncbi:hypothetical protein GCM10023082_19790 [Streptomyces tremellae]|uniref:MarR family transcriptional regulator n=2 Tax=Streptomyces TaxID=1883 RepID=A0ABP7EP35_9ACTN